LLGLLGVMLAGAYKLSVDPTRWSWRRSIISYPYNWYIIINVDSDHNLGQYPGYKIALRKST